MKNLFINMFILFWMAGCGEESKSIPPFTEINNPLDQEGILKSTLEEATQHSDLIISLENGVEIYRRTFGTRELFSGWVKKNYADGKIGYLFQCQNGKQDGLHTSWYKNGKKMVERTWKEGLRDGAFKLWTEAGTLESRGYNNDNLRHGLFEEFYSNGTKKSEVEYINGKIESFFKWKPDGTQCPNSLVKGGEGLVFHYNEDGSVDSNQSYFEGDYDYRGTDDPDDSPLISEEIISEETDLNSSINIVPKKIVQPTE